MGKRNHLFDEHTRTIGDIRRCGICAHIGPVRSFSKLRQPCRDAEKEWNVD